MSNKFVTVDKSHWEANWRSAISNKPLSLLNVFNYDICRLFKRELKSTPRPKMVEIGFAPGKLLRHFEKHLAGSCVGYDYSEIGCDLARKFLGSERSRISIVCQDVIKHPPSNEAANCVYSVGVVEHFEDPDNMVWAHLAGLEQRGKVIIVMPNYTGLNGRLQRFLDPENISIHNLALMTPAF